MLWWKQERGKGTFCVQRDYKVVRRSRADVGFGCYHEIANHLHNSLTDFPLGWLRGLSLARVAYHFPRRSARPRHSLTL